MRSFTWEHLRSHPPLLPGHPGGWWVALGAVMLVAAACSSGGASTPTSTTPANCPPRAPRTRPTPPSRPVDTATEPTILRRRVEGDLADRARQVTPSGGRLRRRRSPENDIPEADEQGLNDAFIAYRTELTSLAGGRWERHLAEDAVTETFVRPGGPATATTLSRVRCGPGCTRSNGTCWWTWLAAGNARTPVTRGWQSPPDRSSMMSAGHDLVAGGGGGPAPDARAPDGDRGDLPERTDQQGDGRRLAVPEGTVRSRLFYALKALKLTLEEMGWGQ